MKPQEKKTGRAGVTRLCESFTQRRGRKSRNNRQENNVLAAITANTKRSKNANSTAYAAITQTTNDRLIRGTSRNPQFILFRRAKNTVDAIVLAVF